MRSSAEHIEISPSVLYAGTPVVLGMTSTSQGRENALRERQIVLNFPSAGLWPKDHIDTRRWQPLLYVFRHYFGTGPDLGRTFKAEI